MSKKTELAPKVGDMRVWWIPQLGCRNTFYVPVDSVEQGANILVTLGRYDIFQFDNNIKPDFANAGGLQVAEDVEDGGIEWCDWFDEDSCEDDPINFVRRGKQ